jgi:hypothetical protein
MFRRLVHLGQKKQIIDQRNCVRHEFPSSQNFAFPMYHARRRNTSRNAQPATE